MKLSTWNIHGDTGFHFGRHGIGQETTAVTFPSDSLFAALVSQLSLIESADFVSEWCEKYRSDPSFVLTSAFPRVGRIRLFPLPLSVHQRLPEIKKRENRASIDPKALKNISFISQSLLSHVLLGKVETLVEGKMLQNGQVLVSEDEYEATQHQETLWEVYKRPRVTVGRASEQSNLFHTGSVTFAPNCGLWFGILWLKDDPDEKERLAHLFALLGDSGLGGERSAGMGAAEISPAETIELPDVTNGGHALLLSRYIPQADEVACLRHPQSRYRVVAIGGWAQSSQHAAQRRKTTTMIDVGSVLVDLPRQPAGCMVDVRPTYDSEAVFPHPIWRAGLAAVVGFKGETL